MSESDKPSRSAGPLLHVDDLRVQYDRGRRDGSVLAVDGVTFSIGAGQTIGLVGESGSGKSSVGRAILGLVRPSSGQITLEGSDVTTMSVRKRSGMGSPIHAIFQDPHSSFNPSRTIGRSLTEGLCAVKGMKKAEALTLAAEMLDRVGIETEALDRYPSEFSGGQRQRIAIARALVLNPKLIICDEPVSALDLSVQAQVLNLFRDLQRDLGISYLFIAHDLSVVRFISDQIMVMYKGRIVEVGPAQAIYDSPQHPYTRSLLDAIPSHDSTDDRMTIDDWRASNGPDGANPGENACAFASRCPHARGVCRTARPALEPARRESEAACHRWRELNL